MKIKETTACITVLQARRDVDPNLDLRPVQELQEPMARRRVYGRRRSSLWVEPHSQNLPMWYMAVCQNLVPLVTIKIAGKWMFIPLKMVLICIDPYPYIYIDAVKTGTASYTWHSFSLVGNNEDGHYFTMVTYVRDLKFPYDPINPIFFVWVRAPLKDLSPLSKWVTNHHNIPTG